MTTAQFYKTFNQLAFKFAEIDRKKDELFQCYCCKDVWPNKSKVEVAPGVDFDEWCYLKLVDTGI